MTARRLTPLRSRSTARARSSSTPRIPTRPRIRPARRSSASSRSCARRPDSQSVPAIRGSAGLSVPDWIHTVDGDVASYWQKQFNDAGYRYRPATEHIFDRTAPSACGKASPKTGPFYCPTDGGIYFPVRFFDDVAAPFGDAATAVVVAHENGHRVQDLLGEFGQPISSAQIELQADCLAGVWAKTVYKRGLLEEGDIGEILGLVNISGDSPETPINGAGRARQLAAAHEVLRAGLQRRQARVPARSRSAGSSAASRPPPLAPPAPRARPRAGARPRPPGPLGPRAGAL